MPAFDFYDKKPRPPRQRRWQYSEEIQKRKKENTELIRKIYELEQYIRENIELPSDWIPPITITPVEMSETLCFRVNIYVKKNLKDKDSPLNKKIEHSYFVENYEDGYIFTPPPRNIPEKCLI